MGPFFVSLRYKMSVRRRIFAQMCPMFHIHMHGLSCQIRCQNNANKDAHDQVFIVPGLGYFAVIASHCQEKSQGVLSVS